MSSKTSRKRPSAGPASVLQEKNGVIFETHTSKSAVVQTNLTDHPPAEAGWTGSEQRFRILFDQGPVAVYSCGLDGVIQEFNQRSAELWGRKPKIGDDGEKFCGAGRMRRANGTLVPRQESPMAAVLAGKISRVRDLEIIIQRPDQSRITVIANIVPLRNERGEITGAINCFYDITERKQAETALLKMKNKIARHAVELERLVTQRTDDLLKTIGELEAFSYSIAHDMRAPLRAMRGFAEILLEDHSNQLDAEGSHYLERIRNAAGRMDRLIHDVLDYSQVLHAEVKVKPVDLQWLVREIIDTYPQLHRGDVDIQIEGPLPKVLGTETALAQCLSNLLTNAVKFVAPKTRPRIRIRSETSAPYVKLWVEDNGIGIAPKDQPRILNLFERVDSANRYEGTGVGLTIVRKAVEKMGGRMGIESKADAGSKFWIELKQAAR